MKRIHPQLWLFLFCGTLPLVILGYYMVTMFPALPERVATHWDWQGDPNGWMSREQHYLFLSLFIGGMNLLLSLSQMIPVRFHSFPHKYRWLADPTLQAEMMTRLGLGLLIAMVLINWIALAGFHMTVSQAIPLAVPFFSLSVRPFLTICVVATVSFLIWWYRFMKLSQ